MKRYIVAVYMKPKNTTYCFDALMKDRFMNKIKLAKFSNEFDVSQHLDLSNGSLFLLLGEEGAVMLIIDYTKEKQILVTLQGIKLSCNLISKEIKVLLSTFLVRFSNSS